MATAAIVAFPIATFAATSVLIGVSAAFITAGTITKDADMVIPEYLFDAAVPPGATSYVTLATNGTNDSSSDLILRTGPDPDENAVVGGFTAGIAAEEEFELYVSTTGKVSDGKTILTVSDIQIAEAPGAAWNDPAAAYLAAGDRGAGLGATWAGAMNSTGVMHFLLGGGIMTFPTGFYAAHFSSLNAGGLGVTVEIVTL